MMAIARDIRTVPVAEIPYEKDPDGNVLIQCDARLTPRAQYGEAGIDRNHAGRVFVPPGRKVRVAVLDEDTGREIAVIARFVSAAAPGKMNCAYVHVRAEGGVDEPAPPEPDPAPEL